MREEEPSTTAPLQARPFPGYLFRPMQEADLEAMYQLDLICFEQAFRFDRKTMRRFATARDAISIVAEASDRLAAFIILNLRAHHQEAYLTTLDVHPAHRRSGLATSLLQHAVQLARTKGCRSLRLHVWEKNLPAIQFYERAGFTRVRIVPLYYGDSRDAWEYVAPW